MGASRPAGHGRTPRLVFESESCLRVRWRQWGPSALSACSALCLPCQRQRKDRPRMAFSADSSSHELATRASYPLHVVDAWWRAANYLTVGQIYLKTNPLLTSDLTPEHI